jgi:hypothetical protein
MGRNQEQIMSKTTLAWALALSTAIATPALAQSDGTTNSGGMVKQPEQATTAPAATMGTAGGFITQAQMGQYRASKLVGVNIYNGKDENIGEVNELIVDGSGKVLAVVIGVGGFLGIGEKSVALKMDGLQISNTAEGAVQLTMDAKKEELASAPSFKSKREADNEKRAAEPNRNLPSRPGTNN